ncbi:MAG TPA: DNA-3-methyladenine glycosylase 2 family protein [Alphaproteobacteria bacterium]|jgi:DNA-3-methyladenine glycosylase II|nr:DNA-3-methyladenine glycosylase 2 family protein [Alphaproteobacteria bacterium]
MPRTRNNGERPLEPGFLEVAALDADLAGVLRRHGQPHVRTRPQGFATLLKILVEQQVSLAAANAIWARLESGLGGTTPERVLAQDEAALCGFGLSRPKARYALALAEAVQQRRLKLRALARMPDEEAIAALTEVKGIGRWTAEIYLLAALRRPDVWPAGDVALMWAAQDLKGLPARPEGPAMLALAEDWRPWRTYAARLLWHHYRHTRMRQTAL